MVILNYCVPWRLRGYLAEMSPDYYVRTNVVDARNKELFPKRPNYEVYDIEYGNQGDLDYINMQDAWKDSKIQA